MDMLLLSSICVHSVMTYTIAVVNLRGSILYFILKHLATIQFPLSLNYCKIQFKLLHIIVWVGTQRPDSPMNGAKQFKNIAD